jgi:hypothetical protein
MTLDCDVRMRITDPTFIDADRTLTDLYLVSRPSTRIFPTPAIIGCARDQQKARTVSNSSRNTSAILRIPSRTPNLSSQASMLVTG